MYPRELCDQLVYADTESAVVAVLKDAGTGTCPKLGVHTVIWRITMGIGNQQSEVVAALVEKVVNAIDARLTNECLERGEDPESPDSPHSVREGPQIF